MPTFDINAYFAARTALGNPADKIAELEAASQAKATYLEEQRFAAQQRLQQKAVEQAAVDASWSGQLGLESGGFLGNRVNEAAFLVSGASRLAGHITSAVPNIMSGASTQGTDQADTEAWNRVKTGQATPEDQVRLDQASSPNTTVRQSFENAESLANTGKKINEFFKLDSIVDPTHRNKLTKQLGDGFEEPWAQLSTGVRAVGDGDVLSGSANAVTGLAKLLLSTGDAVLSNPSGVKEYVLENAPQLFIGAAGAVGRAGMLTSNLGYAAETYRQGIENYAKENGGQLPSEAERQVMAMKSASLAAAEQFGDVVGLGVTKLGAKAADDAIRTGFKESLKNVTKAAGKGAAVEGPTEGYQTYMEGDIVGDDVTAADIYTGAVIGAASGGVLSGGGRAVAEMAGTTPEKITQKKQATAQKELVQAAIETGDVSALADPSKPSYAPEKAIAALFGNSQLPTTTPEVKEANLVKANEVVAELEERHAAKKEELTLTSVDGINGVITSLKETLATLDPEDTYAQNIQKKLEFLEKEAEYVTTSPVPEKDIATLKREVEAMDRQLVSAQEVLSTFTRESQAKDIDVDAQVAIINEPVKADAPAAVVARSATAAESVINLSMALPERLDAQVASELAENKSNALTEPQREYLRAFSAARLAENGLKDIGGVSEEIYTGSDKHVGIAQYRTRMASALTAGSQKQADKQLSGITSFMKDHQAKAKLAVQALEEFQRTGKAVQVLSDGNRGWSINRGAHLSFEKVAENGGLTIYGKTPEDLVLNIETEAHAIATAVKELQVAYQMKFSKGSSNVQNSTQRKETQSNRESSSSSVSTTEVGEATTGKLPGAEGDSGKVVAEKATVVDEENSVSSVTTEPTVKTEETKSQLQSTQDATTPSERTSATQDKQDAFIFKLASAENFTELRKGINSLPVGKLASIVEAINAAISPLDNTNPFWQRNDIGLLDAKFEKNTAAALDMLDERLNSEEAEQQQSTEKVTTKDLAETVEQQTEVVEETTVTDPVDSGTLSTLTKKSPEGTPHNEKKFGDFFSISAGKETDETKRPLASVGNFLSAVADGSVNLFDYIKDPGTKTTPEVWNVFTQKVTEWSPVITRNLRKNVPAKYNYKDPIRYLTVPIEGTKDGSVDIPENVKVAMVVAGFSYIADQATRPEINDDKAINGILGRSKDSPVSSDAKKLLEPVGVYQPQVVDSLGTAVMDALGYKIDPSAPLDMQAKMRASLGGHVLKLMEDIGLLQRTEISNGEMNALRGEDLYGDIDASNEMEQEYSPENQRKGHIFYKVTRDDAGNLSNRVAVIADSIRGSQSFIQKLFGVEDSQAFPGLVPSKNVQKNTDTGMGVPSFIKKVFKKNQQRPWKVNKDPVKVLSVFSEEDALEMLGVEQEISHTHKRNLNSKRAKYDGLKREYQSFVEFLGNLVTTDKGTDQEFFLDQILWKQQRSGYTSNTINPNTSKVIRWLTAAESWTSDIKLSNDDQVQSFMLRVSEGFGIKPEKADSQKAVDALQKTVQDPVITKAIKTLQSVLFDGTTELTDEQKQDIKQAVKMGKQKLHTLASLVAYARYQQATDTKADAFTTNIMGEVDGVSNGSILNAITYGAAATAEQLNTLVEKGGIFTLASPFRKYNLWRGTPGHQDIYETNAQDLHAAVNQLPAELQRITAAIWATAGSPIDAAMEATKDGRDLLKGPINPLNYGGGFKSILGKMSYNYVDKLYDMFEEFSRKGTDQTVIDNFIENTNTLLKQYKAAPIPMGKPIAFYLGYTMSKRQEAALRTAYTETIGEATKQVIGRNFEQFLARSKVVTKTVNLTYGLYEAVYNTAREALIKELGIPSNKEGLVHDLNSEQERLLAERLKDIKPIMHTAMSKAEGNVENGILLAKSKRKQNNTAPYSVEITFGSKLKNGASQMTVAGRSVVQDTPGVIAISGTTHALDSYGSHLTQEAIHVVNNHDAVGAGINELASAAELLNKATWTNTLNYSPLNEAHDALMRVVNGINAMDQRGELTPEMKQAINKVLSSMAKKAKMKHPVAYLDTAVLDVFAEALEANKIKYGAMSQWAVVDQYAMDGGSYEVTDSDRQEVIDRLNTLPSVPAAEDTQALGEFATVIFGKQASQNKPEAKKTEQPKTETISTISPVGTPVIPSDPDLVAFFEATPDADAQQVIRELYKKLSKAPKSRTKTFNLKLLTLLSKTVNPALKLRYVTPATAEGQVLAKPATKARGWYVSKDMQEGIYVLSPDFIHSGLTGETLLHELTHSALARTVEGATGEVKELVAELEVLRTRAENYIKEQGLTQYNVATTNVQELIAWGMTNQGFQRDVLNNVQVETKTGSNTLVTGMKKFIDSIVGLLFKGSSKTEQEQAVNGMTVLISNVSGLFYEAAKTKTTADIVLAQESVVDAIHNYSTLDIHEALGDGSTDPTFDTHLRGLFAGIVHKLHGPYGSFKESLMKNQANSPMDVWMKALDTGVAPFASQVMAHLAVTSQEAFAIEQVEATVKAALDGNESLTKMAYKELSKLYSEAYKLLKPSDFNSQAEYDFIFKMTSDNGDRSDYLARFAALGLAHQGFNKLLQVATERDTRRIKDAGTFAERIQLIFERVLEFFQKKITHTFDGQQADEKLKALVEQLVDIEAKKRFTLSRRETETNYIAPVEKGVKATTEAIRKKIVEVAGSEFVRESASGYVRGAGAIARTIANDQVDQFLNGVSKLRDRHFKGVPGLAAGMINTLRGPLEQYQELLRMTKNHERERKAIISNRTALALTAFSEQGKNLSKEAKASITSVFMRTGAHNLIGSFTLAEIESLVSNRASLLKAISTFEGKLTGPLKSKYIEQSNVLGHYKATGLVSGLLMMNAHLIASMAGTKYEAKITQEQASKVEEDIKVLSTLYALKYTAESDLFQAKEIIRTENHRSDGNGVEFVLALHKRLEQESLEKLFKGNPALMVHGFTPEIVNPNTDIKIANVMGGQDLINQGYSKGAAVPQDAADPDQTTKHVYVLKDGGLAPWLTGVFSLSNMKAKGTKKHDGYVNPKTATGVANASMQAAITAQKLNSLSSNADPRRDLSQETESQMAPVYNEQGQIVNWRYLMQEQTKNNLLERDNAFERIMGVLAGSIYDKQTTQEQNKIAVQALYEEFQTGYKDRPESYLRIGPKSTNPELRQIWHLLPDATKKDIRNIWGEDEMSVRSDSLDIMFGYRKLSLADMFKKDPAARNALEKLFVSFMEHTLKMHGKINKRLTDQEAENYAKRAAVAVTRGERAWMELVSEVKDIIVVKTGMVMLGNIYSNISLLWMNGVPWSDMVHHHLVALKGATAYQQDTAELAKYQTMLDTGYTQGNEAEIQRNIVRLKDALARNPVGKLIDAGLMPTIVEDLTADTDLYSYKSALARKTERFTNALPPSVKAAGRVIYMTHDTKMYQGLSRITQLSDFVARYTLYQHLTTKKDSPLSEKEAIQSASDAFVNYDIPLHRKMQFTDDLGVTMFTKYFMQIQRVLFKLSKDNPARVLLTIALGNLMSLGPIVLEGSALTRIGNNPFGLGALNYPDTLEDLGTVSGAMALIK